MGRAKARQHPRGNKDDWFHLESSISRAASSGPSLGGLDSSPIFTPASRSAAEATGPIDATSVRFKSVFNSFDLFIRFATEKRFLTYSSLVTTRASLCPTSRPPTTLP